MIYRSIGIIIVVILCSLRIYGQSSGENSDKQAIVISSLTSPVNFDGIPDEDSWQSLTPFKLTMHAPVFGREPTEKTDIRIGFDDKYLYIGAYCFYNDVNMIRSASYKRDFMGMGGDWIGILLDTYNDKENSVAFFASPDALRYDGSIQRDAVMGPYDQMPVNINWNTFWDVETNINDKGWSAEIRIPLSSIRFQEVNGETRMGLTIERWIPAKNEIDLYPAIPPNWGETSAIKPSQAQEVVFKGLKPGRPVYIAPYALAGYESLYDLNAAGDAYDNSQKPALDAGLDVKLGLSSNLTLDLTVNTDFAQVEVDDQQFNLTRYSMFFPEKRTFFLERSSNFDFSLGGNNNIFYSRRIGLSDYGDPVRIYGGARISGRLGKWDLGLLDMQTAPLTIKQEDGILDEVMPSENFGVIRLRRQVINENSYIGTILASRLGMNGNYNLAYGVDAIVRVFGEDYLDIKFAQTLENDTVNGNFYEPMRFTASWERRSKTGFGYNAGYSYSGIHFNPGMGFEMNSDYSNVRVGINYGWMPGEDSKLFLHSPSYMLRYSRYVVDGSLMTLQHRLGWTFQTKSQMQGSINLMLNSENLKDSLVLLLDEADVPPGRYDFFNVMGMMVTPPALPLWAMIRTDFGRYYDGSRFSINIQPTWNASKHFEFGGTYSFDHVNFKDRDQMMTNHIIGIKALYMLNIKFSVNAFIQYNTAINEVYSNIRLRYNPKEGNDLYLVFNEGRNTNLTREIPAGA